MNRISDYQILTLRTGQVVLQFVLRENSGLKSVQRIFATSTIDAYSRIPEVEANINGW